MLVKAPACCHGVQLRDSFGSPGSWGFCSPALLDAASATATCREPESKTGLCGEKKENKKKKGIRNYKRQQTTTTTTKIYSFLLKLFF